MEDNMKNIAIVGLDNAFVKKFAQKIAREIGYKYIDANEKFDKDLLANINYPMILVDELLDEKENRLIEKLTKNDNTVISISDDMFLSNEHYKILEETTVILILDENVGKIKKNIEKMIEKHANFVFNKNEIKTNDIIKIVRG